MKEFRVALIGVGGRGEGLYRVSLRDRKYLHFVAVCDGYADRCEYIANEMEEDGRPRPALYDDYKKCIDETKPDAVVVATSWQAHIEVCMYAMEAGVPVACEVGGAYSLESLWELVRCYERTQTPIMMIENCCYGRLELLALHMKRLGKLGDVVHCAGAYRHDLREEVTSGAEKRHYRLQQYIHRNCENYPTHEIGPIAKLLDVNCGNRFVSLVSVGSKSVGLETYVNDKNIQSLKGVKFQQSDVVTTVIKCQNGETVTITLDTCLPRYYSRGFYAQGTKGLISEDSNSVYLEEDFPEEIWDWSEHFNNVATYYEKYDHPLWKQAKQCEFGHDDIDVMVFDAFFEALDKGEQMPIDVYDMATWMAVTVLSEQSIQTGQTVAFPDFTNGKWVTKKNTFAL